MVRGLSGGAALEQVEEWREEVAKAGWEVPGPEQGPVVSVSVLLVEPQLLTRQECLAIR